MLIEFRCPHCKVTLRASIKLSGNKGMCPNRKNDVIVPRLSKKFKKKINAKKG